jgi:hypothetical protein
VVRGLSIVWAMVWELLNGMEFGSMELAEGLHTAVSRSNIVALDQSSKRKRKAKTQKVDKHSNFQIYFVSARGNSSCFDRSQLSSC